MEWYETFGWSDNPFSTRPSINLVGLEEEKKNLQYFAKTGVMCLVTGPTGSGKSSLLMWLEKKAATMDLKPIRINTVIKYKRKDIEKEITQHKTFRDRLLLRKYPRNSILLLDEAQYLPNDSTEFIKVLWDERDIYGIVLASIERDLENFTGSFKDRILGQIIALPTLDMAGAVSLIKIRVGENNPFDVDAMTAIAEASDYIPRRTLETCRDICKMCAGENIREINKYHVYRFLGSEVVPRVEIKIPRIRKTKVRRVGRTSETKSETSSETGRQVGLTDSQAKLIDTLTSRELSAQQIASMVGSTRGSIAKQLSRLKEKDIVVAVSEKRPVRYALTQRYRREVVSK